MSKEPRKSAWGAPFGPVIYQSTISDELHRLMLDEAIELQKKKENDYRQNLAGNIEEEYAYSDAVRDRCTEEILYLCSDYSEKIGAQGALIQPWTKSIPENELVLPQLWVNFQKAGEWNPPHCHSGLFSFVTYLQVPPEIGQEKDQEHQKNSFPSAGLLQFDYGEHIPFTNVTHQMLPKEKMIVFFPARLRHYVYPFKSEVTRISVSGNVFSNKTNWQNY